MNQYTALSVRSFRFVASIRLEITSHKAWIATHLVQNAIAHLDSWRIEEFYHLKIQTIVPFKILSSVQADI
jgi:hypothetical protein